MRRLLSLVLCLSFLTVCFPGSAAEKNTDPFEVLEISTEESYGDTFKMVVTLKNLLPESVKQIHVSLCLLDRDSNILDTASAFFDGRLRSGQSAKISSSSIDENPSFSKAYVDWVGYYDQNDKYLKVYLDSVKEYPIPGSGAAEQQVTPEPTPEPTPTSAPIQASAAMPEAADGKAQKALDILLGNTDENVFGFAVRDQTIKVFGGRKISGEMIWKMIPGSAAQRSGLDIGDLILAVNGTAVYTTDKLASFFEDIKEGDKLLLTVFRNKNIKIEYVFSGSQPASNPVSDEVSMPAPEVTSTPNAGSETTVNNPANAEEKNKIRKTLDILRGKTDENRFGFVSKHEKRNTYGGRKIVGEKVWKIIPGTAAQKSGLQVGDIIIGVDGIDVSNEEEFASVFQDIHPGDTISLTVFRNKDIKIKYVFMEPETAPVPAPTPVSTPAPAPEAASTPEATATPEPASTLEPTEVPYVLPSDADRSIAIKTGNRVVSVGRQLKLAAEISRLKDEAPKKSVLIWTSEDEKIAKVSPNGDVTGVAAGFTWISCSLKDNPDIKAFTGIKVVQPVKGVKPEQDQIMLLRGASEAAAKGKINVIITPDDATIQECGFSSANESIVTVDEDGNLQAVAPGKTRITIVPLEEGSNVKGYCNVTVGQAVTSISIPKAKTVNKKKTVSLQAEIKPKDATTKKLEYSSSNPSVATVAQNGAVTGIECGKTIITCKATDGSGVTAKCEVTVIQPVTRVSATSNRFVLFEGQTGKWYTSVEPYDATNKKLTYSSDDYYIATVDNSGTITGKHAGKTRITATSKDGSNRTCTSTVFVEPSVPISLESIGHGIYAADLLALTVRNECSTMTIVDFDFDLAFYDYSNRMVNGGSFSLGKEERIGPGVKKTIKRNVYGTGQAYKTVITITGVTFADGSTWSIPSSKQETWSFTR